MKLQLMNGKQYFICLPNSIAKAKGWNKGDDIKCKIGNEGEIILVKNGT